SQVRAYLALALSAGSAQEAEEAVALAGKNLRLPAVADAKLSKGRERTMVNRITLGQALLGARRYADAAREVRETLESNRDWNANYDLRWSALHLLARALEAQGNFEEAAAAARDALKFGVAQGNGSSYFMQVVRGVAARDYAAAAAQWKGAPAQ